MKRMLLIFGLLLFVAEAFSQIFVEGLPLEQVNGSKPVLIMVPSPMCKTKALYKIPDKCKLLSKKYMPVTDENGRVIIFNTVADVIGYFQDNGWTYVDNFADVNGDESLTSSTLYLIFLFKETDASAGKVK